MQKRRMEMVCELSRSLFYILLIALQSISFADESTDAVNAWAKGVSGRLKILNQETAQPLVLHPKSLIRWTNPIVGQIYGDSYLWLDDGRPAAFLSIYAIFDTPEGNRRLTFQSLSHVGLKAELDGNVIWSPTESGIDFQKLTSFPDPPANPTQQFLQQRRIAKLFSGSILSKSDKRRFRELRLLSTPLLQYQSPNAEVESGSLFAMVDGTDGEILLLVEVQLVKGVRQWRYAIVRQNHRQLQVRKAADVVWEVPSLAPPFPNPKISSPSGIYYNTKWDDLQSSAKR